MKITKYDYTGLVLLIIFSALSVTLFSFAVLYAENKSAPAIFAIISSVLAMVFSPSLTNIYLKIVYHKSTESAVFYGRYSTLIDYHVLVGEYFRGVTLFSLLFIIPAILSGNWLIILFFVALTAIFVALTAININEFKQYLGNHLTTNSDN